MCKHTEKCADISRQCIERITMQEMMLHLVTNSAGMAEAWRVAFRGCENVAVYCMDFRAFIEQHPEIDAVVSPANSYGLMDGLFDKAIIDAFGHELAERVRACILERFCGEQPVATSISVPIPGHENMLLIHTPTMRVPSCVIDPMVAYQCMRTSLMEAMRTSRKRIVVPAFGGECGLLPFMKIAQLMWEGYQQVSNPPKEITWEYAASRELEEWYR